MSRTINGLTSLGGVGDSGYTGDFVEYQPGYYRAIPKIQISRESSHPDATAVHEYTHSRNNDSRYSLRKFKQGQDDVWTVQLDPAMMDIRQKLENIYHIAENYKKLPYDSVVENAPTHAENQFAWMNDAAGKLGHLPSVEEYDDFINNVPLIELKKRKGAQGDDTVNDYELESNKAAVKKYRQEAEKMLQPPVEIPDAGMVTVRFKPAVEGEAPWPSEISLDSARQTPWYKAAPDVFDAYFADPYNDSWGVSRAFKDSGAGWFDPRRVYRAYRNMEAQRLLDEKYGEGTYTYGVSDEEAEKYREALLNLFSNNSRNSAGNTA